MNTNWKVKCETYCHYSPKRTRVHAWAVHWYGQELLPCPHQASWGGRGGGLRNMTSYITPLTISALPNCLRYAHNFWWVNFCSIKPNILLLVIPILFQKVPSLCRETSVVNSKGNSPPSTCYGWGTKEPQSRWRMGRIGGGMPGLSLIQFLPPYDLTSSVSRHLQ